MQQSVTQQSEASRKFHHTKSISAVAEYADAWSSVPIEGDGTRAEELAWAMSSKEKSKPKPSKAPRFEKPRTPTPDREQDESPCAGPARATG